MLSKILTDPPERAALDQGRTQPKSGRVLELDALVLSTKAYWCPKANPRSRSLARAKPHILLGIRSGLFRSMPDFRGSLRSE